MVLPVSRLTDFKKIVSRQVVSQLSRNHFLKNLWNQQQVCLSLLLFVMFCFALFYLFVCVNQKLVLFVLQVPAVWGEPTSHWNGHCWSRDILQQGWCRDIPQQGWYTTRACQPVDFIGWNFACLCVHWPVLLALLTCALAEFVCAT